MDFLSKKKKVNEGEVPQYYVEGNHPAIISPQEFDGGEKYGMPHLDEESIKEFFVKAANALLTEKDEIIGNFNAIKDRLFDTQALETERSQFQQEVNVVAELIQQCISENARVALDQTEYQKRYDGLAVRLDDVQERLNKVSQTILEKQAHREKVEMFLDELKKQEELVTGFDEDLWYSLVEYVTVFSKEDVRFTFKDGTEIKV